MRLQKNQEGQLEFAGDFDGYYQNDDDPWGKSTTDISMAAYYKKSRARTRELANATCTQSLLVVGCGADYTMKNYQIGHPKAIVGMDVSGEAIQKVQASFPEFRYIKGDIMNRGVTNKIGINSFETVIFEQILWYILEGLDNALENSKNLLKNDGTLIISSAFSREQHYGRNVINGYQGAVRYFNNLSEFRLESAHHYDDGFVNTDGHFCLKRV